MKNNFHEFRKNSKLKMQTNFIFVDTESNEKLVSNEQKVLTFKMGCSIFWNKEINEIIRETFYNISDFWNQTESMFNDENKEIILFAHNTQFDFKMLNGFEELFKRGWKLETQYVKNKTFILVFKKKRFVLHCWDTMNYVARKLEVIGESVGFPKLKVDFKNVSDKDLEIYCKRDTEIIFEFIKKLIEFLEKNNLSKLKATAGSLSFNIFRHKFYNPIKTDDTTKIFIHDWKQAIKLERESYRGGITDCFKLTENSNLYKMDINSMYPGIMKTKLLPYKLLFYSHESKYTSDKLMEIYNKFKKDYGVIMKATIYLPKENAYILNNFKDIGINKSLFAYGEFVVSLCTPELNFVENNSGKIIKIHQIAIYNIKPIFKEFVSFFYDLKVQFKKQDNKVDIEFTKLILNTQYGKWGQRNIIYEQLDKDNDFVIKNKELIKLMINRRKEFLIDGKWKNSICYLGTIVNDCELYVINGKLYSLKQTNENAKETFVAISSFITSYARMQLISYLKIAQRKNVWYTDTDSLFINQNGYNNLDNNDCIDELKLGKLKVEDIGSGIFYAPKFYDFNGKRRCKGIKKDSKILFENKQKVIYEIELWQRYKMDLKNGIMNKQFINKSEKYIRKYYNKGKVDKYGNIFPYSIYNIIEMNNV